MAIRSTSLPDTLRYADFTLAVTQLKGHVFSGRVVQSPAGESGEFTFQLSVTPAEIEDALASVMYSSGNYLKRSSYSSSYDPIIAVGEKLYQGLVRESTVGRLLVQAQEVVSRRFDGLRLRVQSNDPAVLALPWEFLFDSLQTNFLALSLRTPIMRQVMSTPLAPPAPVTPPLRVLAAVAEVAPRGAAEELAVLQELAGSGVFELQVIEKATATSVRAALQQATWHVFHFIGAGAYATGAGRWAKVKPPEGSQAQQGVLLFGRGRSKDPLESAEFLPASTFANLLADAADLRLVLLNACATDQVAATVAQRIPAVLGVRSDITDLACHALTRGLYEGLIAGQPLEAAVTLGRQSIDRNLPGTREWGLPTFYLSTAEGKLLAGPTLNAEAAPAAPQEAISLSLQANASRREVRRIQSQIELEQRNLNDLLAQKAALGDKTPEFTLNQIAEATARLDQLNNDLSALT